MKPENQTVNRLVGLDIVRTVAVICVICGHFFSINTPYNQTPYEGSSMYFQGFLKSVFCSVGVPFFLLLSGFLCCHKSLSISYYKSIRKVLVPYLVISIIAWIVLSSSYSLHKMILGILGFKIIGYAWYVEMYLGLFLIIPFINIVLEEVFKKGWTWYLLATALLMTALPALVNRKGITLVPGFWTMTFPVTYYVIGALIRHFEPHWKNKWLAFLGSLLLFAIGPFSRAIIFKVSGGGISASVSGSYYSLINVFATSILFILLYDINNLPSIL